MFKVSILVPFYGVEQYIVRCARSLLEQTYQNIEYVFVNDCSPDRSLELLIDVVEDYPQRKDVVKVVCHDKNRGLAAARNTAIDYATGDFVCHVDSDDWIDPQMVECLVGRQLETNADIVSCDAVIHDPTGERIWEEPEYASKDEMMQSILQLTLDHVIWRRLIRVSLYRENDIRTVEGFNIGEDHYTLPRLLYFADSFAKCNRALYHYNCLNGQSYMQSDQDPFSFKRYQSNIASSNILLDFFSQRSMEYWDLLNEIKAKYIYKYFFIVIKMRNKDFYDTLCADWKSTDDKAKNKVMGCSSGFRAGLLSSSLYSLNRIRVMGRIIIKKVFGIRNYEL